MKKLKVWMMAIMLLSLAACEAKEKVSLDEQLKTLKPYKNYLNKGTDMNGSIFGDKPYYKIEITGSSARVTVSMNGIEIYKNFSGEDCYTKRPINHFVTSGDNELKVLLYHNNHDYTIGKNTKVNVKLWVTSSATKKSYELANISYNNHLKDKLAKSFIAKESLIYEESNLRGEKITRTNIVTLPITSRNAVKSGGVELTQTINFLTPFPRWKFLDSEEISSTLFWEVSEKEAYEKFRHSRKLQGLYDAYQKLHDALQQKDISAYVDMFDERSEEMEYAYYDKEKGNVKKKLFKNLYDDVYDKGLQLADLGYTPSENFFALHPNRKTIHLLGKIAFNNVNGKGSTVYNMKFRLENDKWILTR